MLSYRSLSLFVVLGWVLLFIALSIGEVQAQTAVQEPVRVRRDTTEREGVSFLAIPVIAYTPETKFSFGGGAIAYFNLSDPGVKARPSSVLADVIYTQLGQLTLQVLPQIYMRNEMFFVEGELAYVRFADKFWGVGAETQEEDMEKYDNDIIRIRASLLRRLPPFVNFGLQFQYQSFDMTKREEARLLDTAGVEGAAGATAAAIGVLFNFDSRDNYAAPTSGSFHQFSALMYNRALGGTHSFTQFIFDARHYLPLGDDQTLALQAYLATTGGVAPFQMLPRVGGNTRMRGYFDGRFRDNSLVAFQAEYRLMPLWWRFGVTGFASLGNVGDQIGDAFANGLRLTVGGGLRFAILPEQKTHLRLDFGIGRQTSGIYFGVQEAF